MNIKERIKFHSHKVIKHKREKHMLRNKVLTAWKM